MSKNMSKNSSTQANNINTSSIETQRELRIQKLNRLIEQGFNPYPASSKRDFKLKEVKDQFDILKEKYSENSVDQITLAGRIKKKRSGGKIGFVTLEDESLPSGFQLVFKSDLLTHEANADNGLSFQDFKETIEESDYIQASGYLDRSSTGEESLFITKYIILTKTIRPLPDKLEYNNLEARYLDRVADYKMNTIDENNLSVRDIVKLKSRYWAIWREEMQQEGFLEVECPIFEHTPGGAEAKPFTTFYNELEQDMYLRIALELPLKKLIAGGFESVYEIGRVFRNESSSPQHLQEYTMVEWYKAYADYNWAAKFVKRVYQRVVKEVLGSMEQVDYYDNTINWGEWCSQEEADKNGWELVGGWPKIKYFDAVRYFSNGEIDTENKTAEELVKMCYENEIADVRVEDGMATLLDKLWKKARVNTVHPFFLILPPVELEPLAKRNEQNPNLTERWQIVAGRAELGKAFSELNDPIDQYNRFSEQQKARDNGNEEAQFMDEGYIKAMEYGMPPMSGFGTSERFISFLLGKHIKECTTFPYVKRDEDEKAKSKTMVAHCIILEEGQELWQKMNIASHLSAAYGARIGKELFHIQQSSSKDGIKINMNTTHAIVNKSVSSSLNLWAIKEKADAKGLVVEMFTQDMQNSSDDRKVDYAHSQKKALDIKLLGILVYGKKSDVEETCQ
jgi:lysyl-tRNA synthetase, class II